MDRSRSSFRNTSLQNAMIDLLNHIFEIEKKLDRIEEQNSIDRTLQRIKDLFENGLSDDLELVYENPLGEPYDETRTDCEASIAGESTENLYITEVVKPIIRLRRRGVNQIAQKGIVIVQSEDSTPDNE